MKTLVWFSLLVALAATKPASVKPKNWQDDMRGALPKTTKNGLIDESYRWPNGNVAYEIADTYSAEQRAVVEAAMQEYSDLTTGCITFSPRTSESDYVSFVNYDSGCWSYVGRIGGSQELNYPQWCLDEHGPTMHEMYHALGFFHEQSRTDRDDYVTIVWDNIDPEYWYAFDKYDADYISPFGQPYDYGSAMHYDAYAFSINGEPSIVPTDPNAEIGQRLKLSDIDIAKLLAMYNCPGKK